MRLFTTENELQQTKIAYVLKYVPRHEDIWRSRALLTSSSSRCG
jgi:hypothetical protein